MPFMLHSGAGNKRPEDGEPLTENDGNKNIAPAQREGGAFGDLGRLVTGGWLSKRGEPGMLTSGKALKLRYVRLFTSGVVQYSENATSPQPKGSFNLLDAFSIEVDVLDKNRPILIKTADRTWYWCVDWKGEGIDIEMAKKWRRQWLCCFVQYSLDPQWLAEAEQGQTVVWKHNAKGTKKQATIKCTLDAFGYNDKSVPWSFVKGITAGIDDSETLKKKHEEVTSVTCFSVHSQDRSFDFEVFQGGLRRELQSICGVWVHNLRLLHLLHCAKHSDLFA